MCEYSGRIVCRDRDFSGSVHRFFFFLLLYNNGLCSPSGGSREFMRFITRQHARLNYGYPRLPWAIRVPNGYPSYTTDGRHHVGSRVWRTLQPHPQFWPHMTRDCHSSFRHRLKWAWKLGPFVRSTRSVVSLSHNSSLRYHHRNDSG
jgi:hypothetical protein